MTKYLKGECQHCGGRIEFPVEAVGMGADCPHCGKQTELMLARPPEEPSALHKGRIWAITAMVFFGLGLAAALVALKKTQSWATRQKEQAAAAAAAAAAQKPPPPPEDPWANLGFKVSAIRLEKTPGSSLVYAVGAVANLTDHQRFGVKVELDLLDGTGQKLGTATDYQQVIEPKGRWSFKALVVEKKAVTAKLAAINEQQ